LAGGILFMCTGVSHGLPAAADVLWFPRGGETKEQKEQDEFTFYKGAKEKTGVDPNKPVEQAAAPAPRGGAVSGAAKGAAVGAIGGASAGDAGKGAAGGGGGGAAGGGLQRRQGGRTQPAAPPHAAQPPTRHLRGHHPPG